MKLYHPTDEQEEAAIHARGFRDKLHPVDVDAGGRLTVRVAVAFSDARPEGLRPGQCWMEVDVPDEIAGCFEDSSGPGVPDGCRLFYVPAALATLYLRKQGQ